MKKTKILTICLITVIALMFVFTGCFNPMMGPVTDPESDMSVLDRRAKEGGVTIKDGTLVYTSDNDNHYLEGQLLVIGYDIFGYNYNAHMFRGSYANAYLGRYGFPPYEGDDDTYLAANPEAEENWVWQYRDIQLSMKWNDAWLSNMDRNGDGLLDRHDGLDSYIGSGAWLTNHESGGDDEDHYTSFVKIVAAPADATIVMIPGDTINEEGVWFAADGTEIGPVIWGAFAIIQEVESGLGATYISPAGPGLGKF